jgi:hypothetical protein
MSKQRLTDRTLISGVSLDNVIHVVVTGDTTQNPSGSSFKATLHQVSNAILSSSPFFTGGTISVPVNFTSGVTANTLTVNGVEITGDTFTTSAVLIGNTAYFNTNNSLSAYTLNLSGFSSSVSYTNSTPVPKEIGGIGVGTTFTTPKTMQEMWDLLLYPYQSPAFTSFNLQGIGSSLEIGQLIGVNQTFSWSTSNSGNVNPNSILIQGYNLIPPVTGLPSNGSTGVTFNGVVTRGASDGPGIRSWSIAGVNTNGVSFGATLNLRWDYRMYVGTSPNTNLTANEITGLTEFNSVKNGFVGTYALPAGNYKYFCFADVLSYGTPNEWKDPSNGTNFVLFDSYPNTDSKGKTYDLVSVTNSFGQTTNYRVYRSKFTLAGAISVAIS